MPGLTGPVPLPDHERQRRNPEDRFLVAQGGVSPPEPREYAGWPPDVQDYWQDLIDPSRSPQAAIFTGPEWREAIKMMNLLCLGTTKAYAMATELAEKLSIYTITRRRARIDLPEEAEAEDEDMPDYRAMVGLGPDDYEFKEGPKE